MSAIDRMNAGEGELSGDGLAPLSPTQLLPKKYFNSLANSIQEANLHANGARLSVPIWSQKGLKKFL